MPIVPTDKLQPDMVLAAEVRDITGRLLLTKGKRINPGHIRILKMWGITEVNIAGQEGIEEVAASDADSELSQKIRAHTNHTFSHADLDHPALQEIYKLALRFRCEHQIFEEEKNSTWTADDDLTKPVEQDLVQIIVQKDIKLPEIPSIVFELDEVISNPLATAENIAQVVHKSPSLTAVLLKIVNSSFYGFPTKIDKISLAVTLIGTREISGLALGISVISIFKDIPKDILDMYSFLKHSLACGLISRVLAAHRNLPQTEQLFVAGLLHDIGRLVLYIYFPREARHILGNSGKSAKLLYEEECEFLGCSHTVIGQHLLRKWKLPPTLSDNVHYHHNPSDARRPIPAAVIHLADIMVNGLGIGSSGERFVPPLDHKAWEDLGLPVSCFESVIRQALHQFFALETILQA
ncbi:MAG: HDOD domain-containing protein [Desulfobacterales bacterium]|nr:MAG: HDOD domain-containing protein [Desulfobacterales bacterium]